MEEIQIMQEVLKSKIEEIVKNHKGSNLELLEKLKDIAVEHNTTLLHVVAYVEDYLAIEGEGGITFRGNKDVYPEYIKRRFQGE